VAHDHEKSAPIFGQIIGVKNPMSVTASRITRWTVRFLVVTVTYVVTSVIWAEIYPLIFGWEDFVGFALIGTFVVFGLMLVPTWLAAVALEHLYVPNLQLRLIVHPGLAVGMLLLTALALSASLYRETFGSFWYFGLPFAGCVAVATLFDAAADMLLARKLA
jgi:hypothetical protein